MTDYEYILQQAKKAHYSGWDDAELRKCVDMLTGLTHEQLFALYTSKWLKDEKTLKNEVFRNMFLDKIGKREERIKNMSTEELIAAFREKEKGNVSLIRKEMRDRYKAGRDKPLITMAFNASNKKDQQWIIKQEKKAEDGHKK